MYAVCDYDVLLQQGDLRRQLVGRVFNDDQSGRAIIHVRRSRPVVVGMVPKRASHVVFRNLVDLLELLAREHKRVYDIVSRHER